MLRTSKKPATQELAMSQITVYRNFVDFYQAALRRYSLSTIEWLVLGAISDASAEGGIRVTDLAKNFNVKSTYMTTMLSSLRTKGYIETRFDANDARVRLAYITTNGSKQVSVVEDYMQKRLAQLLDGTISSEEYDKFSRVVQKIARAL